MEESTTKVCPKCGARWMNGKHYWAGTGQEGNETELASLVCDKFGDDTCINPRKGTTDGRGWEERFDMMKNFASKMDNEH
jgi:hypothetical protein